MMKEFTEKRHELREFPQISVEKNLCNLRNCSAESLTTKSVVFSAES